MKGGTRKGNKERKKRIRSHGIEEEEEEKDEEQESERRKREF